MPFHLYHVHLKMCQSYSFSSRITQTNHPLILRVKRKVEIRLRSVSLPFFSFVRYVFTSNPDSFQSYKLIIWATQVQFLFCKLKHNWASECHLYLWKVLVHHQSAFSVHGPHTYYIEVTSAWLYLNHSTLGHYTSFSSTQCDAELPSCLLSTRTLWITKTRNLQPKWQRICILLSHW